MEDKFNALRKQLNCLGYTHQLSRDSLPLVESLTADLVQTTYSLQYYMKLSKESLQQRDTWKVAAEPYRCDNAKLIKDNNKLHQDLLHNKEQSAVKLTDYKRKTSQLEDENARLQEQIKKLRIQCQEYQLKNVCADTISSSKRCKPKETNVKTQIKNITVCATCLKFKSRIEDITKELGDARDDKTRLADKLAFLQSQLIGRDGEIKRLNQLLEGGRPISALKINRCSIDDDDDDYHLKKLSSKTRDLESFNRDLKKQLEDSIAKQHEAMSRAIQLAEHNKTLEGHLKATDQMALKAEAECNSRLKECHDTIFNLEKKLKRATSNLEENHIKLQRSADSNESNMACVERKNNEISALKMALDELMDTKERLLHENRELIRSQRLSNAINKDNEYDSGENKGNCNCRVEIQQEFLKLLEKERKYYESHITDIKNQLSEQKKETSSYNQDFVETLKQERDFFYKECHRLKDTIPITVDCKTQLEKTIDKLEQRVAELTNENKLLIEENCTLKSRINVDIQTQDKHSKALIENLERDLSNSHREFIRLEIERDMLASKLKNASESESTYRQLYEAKLPDEINSRASMTSKHQQECSNLKENLKTTESELMHTKGLYNQLKNLQLESERNASSLHAQLLDLKKELNVVKSDLATCEKQRSELEFENRALKSDKNTLRDNLNMFDRERDKLVIDIDNKTERLSSMEHHLRSKNTTIELLENKVTELNRKLEMVSNEKVSLEHKFRDGLTCNEALSLELDTITKQRDHALIENKRLQSDLSVVMYDMRPLKRDYDKSRREVDEMKQQLQHYVDEVRRIEDILSRKEAERTEMLDHFASLTQEANMLESNNHSLENESASKKVQLQASVEKLTVLEQKLKSRENILEMQEEKITVMLFRITTLESELDKQKNITDNTERMLLHAKEMCDMLENQKRSILLGVGETDSERKNIEAELKAMQEEKRIIEESMSKEKASVECLETLLSDNRQETVHLKTSLREITKENEELRRHLQRVESECSTDRHRNEKAAKQLQELQQQMTEERIRRSGRFHRTDTI